MVRSRLRSPATHRRRIASLVTIGAVAAVGLVAARGGLGASDVSRYLTNLTNQGESSTPMRPRDALPLQKIGASGDETVLLAVQGGRAYYRVKTGCYAVGPAVPTEDYAFGQIMCAPDFPSAERPILDFTVFHRRWDPQLQRSGPRTVSRSEGFAADGIERVAFFAPDGKLLAETPVINNTYRFGDLPDGEVGALRALDAGGEAVFSQKIPSASRSRLRPNRAGG